MRITVSSGAAVVIACLMTGAVRFGLVRLGPPRPHVVLISIDTLRADHLGAYGYGKLTSPFTDSIASRGAVFEDTTVPEPATDPSHAALMTGLHPVKTGLLSNSMVLQPQFETLAEVLRANGYATAAATGVYHLSPQHGFGQGFERFAGPADTEIRRPADAVNRDVLRLIEEYRKAEADRPFFLFVHYFDVHYPYVNHEYPDRFPGDRILASTIEAYDSGVRFVDSHIRSIWSALEQAQLTDNTILAITADHGEQLGEHGVIGSHMDLYRETIRVPFVIAGPGVRAVKVADAVSSMDIAPTILDLVGLRFSGGIDGESLVPVIHGRGEDAGKRRPLLVVGYPQYARSVALRDGPLFYVRNLEWVYRDVTIGPVPHPGAASSTAMRTAESVVEGISRIVTVPALDFEPYRITADIQTRDGCSVGLRISLPSGVDFTRDFTLTEPTRVRYSVARLDSTFLTLSPTSCVDGVSWGFEKLSSSQEAAARPKKGTTLSTSVFETLVPLRKHTSADELFNVRNDPAMTNNVIDSEPPAAIKALRAALEKSFADYRRVTATRFSLPGEELERLRSLGYIK